MSKETSRCIVISVAEALGILLLSKTHLLFPFLFICAAYHTIKSKAWNPQDDSKLKGHLLTIVTGAASVLGSYGGLQYLSHNYSPFLQIIIRTLAFMPSCIAMSRIYAVFTRRKELTEITITALIIWLLITLALLMHFGVLATILGLSWSVVWHFNKSVYKKVRMINNGTVYACILALSSIVSLFLSFINVFHADAYSNLDPLGIIWQIGFYLISTVLVHEAPRFQLNQGISTSVHLPLYQLIGHSISLGLFGNLFSISPILALYLVFQIPSLCLITYDESDLPLNGQKDNIISHILEFQDSRRIALFLLQLSHRANLIFMFVEALYGYWTNSLGLISDSIHMAFDCTALAIGLYASYISKHPPDADHPYGYTRHEVLSGFINGIFLVFVGLNVFEESIERILEPPEVHTEMLLIVSVLGLLVNLIGLFFFHDHHDEGNMEGVFLHVLADTLGSVGVIVSSLCIHFWELYISDPICSLVISVLIFMSVIPLLQNSMDQLFEKASNRKQILNKVQEIQGVVSVKNAHIQELAQKKLAVNIDLEISKEADPFEVTRTVKEAFPDYFTTIQVL